METEQQQPAPQYLTTDEVADICRVHVITVLRWIKSGKLHAKKAGRQFRVTPQDLDDFLEGR